MTDLPRSSADAPSVDAHKTIRWWTVLRGISIFNLCAWLATAARVQLDSPAVQLQLGLSLVFVVVCGFRSFFPRIDLERTCIVDSPWSSMVAGRSAATVAEVSFAGQVGMLVHMMGTASELGWVQTFGVAVVVLLAIAQVFCWWSVVNLSHLGHAIEESIWAGTFFGVGLVAAVCAPQLDGLLHTIALATVPLCAIYVAFMVWVDVPMYVTRWREGRAAGVQPLGLVEGFRDALYRREPTRSWIVWKPEVAWLTGYFSFAVWGSLGLVHVMSALA